MSRARSSWASPGRAAPKGRHGYEAADEPVWARPEGRPERAANAATAPAGGPDFRPGVRVRHPLFGVGTVLRRDGDGEELKLTVSFAGVGAKKLVARYAGLELV